MTLLFNQIKSVFKGDIEIHSDVCLTPNLKDDIQEVNRANYFMSLESTYDQFVDISYSAHISSIYELMRLVSTNLYNGKNPTAIIQGEIDITRRGPFQIIPHTDILRKPNGKHSLKFMILSDTGATNTTSSDNLFRCFTPTMIGS